MPVSNRTAAPSAVHPAGTPDLHYEAAWTDSWRHCRCLHRHPTVAEASQCVFADDPTGYVFAVENGEGRELNAGEERSWVKLRRSQTLSSPKATVTAEFPPPKALVAKELPPSLTTVAKALVPPKVIVARTLPPQPTAVGNALSPPTLFLFPEPTVISALRRIMAWIAAWWK